MTLLGTFVYANKVCSICSLLLYVAAGSLFLSATLQLSVLGPQDPYCNCMTDRSCSRDPASNLLLLFCVWDPHHLLSGSLLPLLTVTLWLSTPRIPTLFFGSWWPCFRSVTVTFCHRPLPSAPFKSLPVSLAVPLCHCPLIPRLSLCLPIWVSLLSRTYIVCPTDRTLC